ncbi:MAG: hypothetical protein IJ678_06670 [Kiritimatiellae bacterium]|nr:hypothetical protein [Kiritimatiellia bacterium]
MPQTLFDPDKNAVDNRPETWNKTPFMPWRERESLLDVAREAWNRANPPDPWQPEPDPDPDDPFAKPKGPTHEELSRLAGLDPNMPTYANRGYVRQTNYTVPALFDAWKLPTDRPVWLDYDGGYAYAGDPEKPYVPPPPSYRARPFGTGMGMSFGAAQQEGRRRLAMRAQGIDPDDPFGQRNRPPRLPYTNKQMAGRMDLSPTERDWYRQLYFAELADDRRREEREFQAAQAALALQNQGVTLIPETATGWRDASGAYHPNPGYESRSAVQAAQGEWRSNVQQLANEGRVAAEEARGRARVETANVRADAEKEIASGNPWTPGGNGTAINKQTGEVVGTPTAAQPKRYVVNGKLLDENGNVLHDATPNDIDQEIARVDKLLEAAYHSGARMNRAEIAALEKQRAALEAQKKAAAPAAAAQPAAAQSVVAGARYWTPPAE